MNLVIVLFGAIVGDAIDHSHRLRAMQVSLVAQNLSVALTCVCISIILSQENMSENFPATFWFLAVLILLFGGVSAIGSLAATLAVEKDWVRTLCAGDSTVGVVLLQIALLNFIEMSSTGPQIFGHRLVHPRP